MLNNRLFKLNYKGCLIKKPKNVKFKRKIFYYLFFKT